MTLLDIPKNDAVMKNNWLEDVYKYLFVNNRYGTKPLVRVPDTVVLKYQRPSVVWASTPKEGLHRRTGQKDLQSGRIIEHLKSLAAANNGGKLHPDQPVAQYVFFAPNRDVGLPGKGSTLTIEYLDARALETLLSDRLKEHNGVIQAFVEPPNGRNWVIRASWSHTTGTRFESSVNIHKMNNRSVPLPRRSATFDAVNGDASVTSLRSQHLRNHISHQVDVMIAHIRGHLPEGYSLWSLELFFKMQKKGRSVLFLFVSNVRVANRAELLKQVSPSRHPAAVSTNSSEHPQSGSHSPTKLPVVAGEPMAAPQYAYSKKDILPEFFPCPSCQRLYNRKYDDPHDVSYKHIVLFHMLNFPNRRPADKALIGRTSPLPAEADSPRTKVQGTNSTRSPSREGSSISLMSARQRTMSSRSMSFQRHSGKAKTPNSSQGIGSYAGNTISEETSEGGLEGGFNPQVTPKWSEEDYWDLPEWAGGKRARPRIPENLRDDGTVADDDEAESDTPNDVMKDFMPTWKLSKQPLATLTPFRRRLVEQEAVDRIQQGGPSADILKFKCLKFLWIADDGITVVPAGDLSELSDYDQLNLGRYFEHFVRPNPNFLEQTMALCDSCCLRYSESADLDMSLAKGQLIVSSGVEDEGIHRRAAGAAAWVNHLHQHKSAQSRLGTGVSELNGPLATIMDEGESLSSLPMALPVQLTAAPANKQELAHLKAAQDEMDSELAEIESQNGHFPQVQHVGSNGQAEAHYHRPLGGGGGPRVSHMQPARITGSLVSTSKLRPVTQGGSRRVHSVHGDKRSDGIGKKGNGSASSDRFNMKAMLAESVLSSPYSRQKPTDSQASLMKQMEQSSLLSRPGTALSDSLLHALSEMTGKTPLGDIRRRIRKGKDPKQTRLGYADSGLNLQSLPPADMRRFPTEDEAKAMRKQAQEAKRLEAKKGLGNRARRPRTMQSNYSSNHDEHSASSSAVADQMHDISPEVEHGGSRVINLDRSNTDPSSMRKSRPALSQVERIKSPSETTRQLSMPGSPIPKQQEAGVMSPARSRSPSVLARASSSGRLSPAAGGSGGTGTPRALAPMLDSKFQDPSFLLRRRDSMPMVIPAEPSAAASSLPSQG